MYHISRFKFQGYLSLLHYEITDIFNIINKILNELTNNLNLQKNPQEIDII